jgi:hypothetical protein
MEHVERADPSPEIADAISTSPQGEVDLAARPELHLSLGVVSREIGGMESG